MGLALSMEGVMFTHTPLLITFRHLLIVFFFFSTKSSGDVQLLPHLPDQRYLPVWHHLHVPHSCPHVHEALPGGQLYHSCHRVTRSMIEKLNHISTGPTRRRLRKCCWCLFWTWRGSSFGNHQYLLQRTLVLGRILHGEILDLASSSVLQLIYVLVLRCTSLWSWSSQFTLITLGPSNITGRSSMSWQSS